MTEVVRLKIFKKIRLENQRDRLKLGCADDDETVEPCCVDLTDGRGVG